MTADISKAAEKLGYDPSYDFAAGIRLAIDWYREYFSQNRTGGEKS